MARITRRNALQTALLGGVAACSTTPEMTPFKSATALPGGIFAHGVASGDPMQDSIVLWTRVSGFEVGSAKVTWQVSAEENFSALTASGEVRTDPSRDWTVKAIASGLEPGASYFYRFLVDDSISPIGRMRPLPNSDATSARFAVVSCSNYPFGYFNVYDLISRAEGLNAVIHLGDYLYEYGRDGYGGSVGTSINREHEPSEEILSLADYRRRHAQYKSDPSAQAMHAAHPMIAIWDDHETANDSWKGGAENHDPHTEGTWDDRRRAAMQAYYEWMPVRDPEPGKLREALFRRYDFGNLLSLLAIETRLTARDAPFTYSEILPRLQSPEDIEDFLTNELGAEDRKLLGGAQIEYIREGLAEAKAAGKTWQVIANQVTMASVAAPNLKPHVTEEDILKLSEQWGEARAFIEFSTLGLPLNPDAWDGYPAERERFYALAKHNSADGLIILTGDTHTWWANDLVAANGDHMGVELGVHSVTSPSPFDSSFLGGKGREYALLTNRDNKSVRYLSGDNHGYIDLSVTVERVHAKYMAVDTVLTPDYKAFQKVAFDIKKKEESAQFDDADGLSFKEGWLF